MGVIEIGRDLANLARQLGSVNIQQGIELQAEVLTMQEKLQSLRAENTALKDLCQIDGELELRENAYWRPTAAKTRQGPFCRSCWDTRQLLVVLNIHEDGHQSCPSCSRQYPTSESKRFNEMRNAEARTRSSHWAARPGVHRS